MTGSIFTARNGRVYHERLGEIFDLREMRRVLNGLRQVSRTDKVAAMCDFRRARDTARKTQAVGLNFTH